jgi:hypothetical protein
MRYRIEVLMLGLLLLVNSAAWAAHPLITDDTGTQGKGKLLVEISAQYDTDKETANGVSTESTGGQVATTLSYGFVENADLVLGLPYQWAKGKEGGVTVYDENGISDMTVDLKWRFFEKDGLSLALKPGVRLPTGNDEKELGTGRTGYQAFLIGSKEAAPWAFHVNLGYIGNENRADEEKHLWHASLAATCEIVKGLMIVGDIGIERNRDKAANGNPAFLIGGFIYSLFDNVDIDIGVKYGLTAAENDWSFMAGTAFRF